MKGCLNQRTDGKTHKADLCIRGSTTVSVFQRKSYFKRKETTTSTCSFKQQLSEIKHTLSIIRKDSHTFSKAREHRVKQNMEAHELSQTQNKY